MSTGEIVLATLIVLLGAGGSYLLLPHRHGRVQTRLVHAAGAVLAGLALLGLLGFVSPPGLLLTGFFFYLFAISAVAGGLMMVTSRNPIYSALWFASVVLSTAGLFVLAGAQFLAAGTVIVYAGAIIVTFLFVIMLAQMEGKAVYDRAARAPAWATFTCFLLFWCLLYVLVPLRKGPEAAEATPVLAQAAETGIVPGRDLTARYQLAADHPARAALGGALRPTSSLYDASGAEKPNVAGLGEALYADHLVSVELAGTLLFVALIAAVAITAPRRPARPTAEPLIARAKKF
jgi:NADH-quinone oxidoreductase subunit J